VISTFERTVAFRYLRARRQEGFISVTAGFSLLGICLGVAALIIVMSVMNGFRYELINRILGFNGHITVIGRAVFWWCP
jgi:lipoprotein-releasing system permease protein